MALDRSFLVLCDINQIKHEMCAIHVHNGGDVRRLVLPTDALGPKSFTLLLWSHPEKENGLFIPAFSGGITEGQHHTQFYDNVL